MFRVYFDTNVFDHIDKGHVAPDDVDALRLELHRGDLSARLSVTDFEELIGQWETDRPAVIRKLSLARDLVGFEKLLKPPNVLLEEAIRAYAGGTSPPSVVLLDDLQEIVISRLHRITNGDTSLEMPVSGIVKQVAALKRTAFEQMTEGRREVHASLNPDLIEPGHSQRKDITWFLKSEEHAYADALAESIGLGEACRSRGLDGLVNIRAVRFYVNALVAYIFDITVGPYREPRSPKHGDDYDFWHLISASTADAFVTYDGRLVKLLSRLPIDGFRVFSSVPALLAEIN